MNQMDNIVYYDDNCVLCLGVTEFIKKRDRKSKLVFKSLRDLPIGAVEIVKEDLAGKESVIFQSGNNLYFRSDAAILILNKLGGFWSLAMLSMVFPRFVRDAFYELFSKNRYRLFGTIEECPNNACD
jgi:predicted DCC family thiol-disulfide oxidoreductase YuxK